MLSHVKAFMNILNHYNKIISPIVFWITLALFIMTLFESYQVWSITFANGMDLVVKIVVMID